MTITVQDFCDHIGIEPIRTALRRIDKHNTEHIWLVVDGEDGWYRVYYHDHDVLDALKPGDVLIGVGVGGIAWDDTDWEYGDEVMFADMHHPWQWSYLDTMREGFHEALAEHNAHIEAEEEG